MKAGTKKPTQEVSRAGQSNQRWQLRGRSEGTGGESDGGGATHWTGNTGRKTHFLSINNL